MDDDTETYILLLLSDSNLPTGSFVASAGLESHIAHGFSSSASALDSTIDFVQDSLSSYARSALPFVRDAHRVVACMNEEESEHDVSIIETLDVLTSLDELYETMTLNHVARRASKSQGVALLTLYTKGFSRPPLSSYGIDTQDAEPHSREKHMSKLVDRLKLMIRREDTHGHLPVCWGVLTAALGFALERSQFLHLFLHARSLLSASVRLNTLGPYAAQQLLLHAVRPLVQGETTRCIHLRTGLIKDPEDTEKHFDAAMDGPAVTWPLGEILAVRHDLQHSRIFNS